MDSMNDFMMDERVILNSYKLRLKKEKESGSTFFHTLLLIDYEDAPFDDAVMSSDFFLHLVSTVRNGSIPAVITAVDDNRKQNIIWEGIIELRGVSNHYSSMAKYLYSLNSENSEKVSFIIDFENHKKINIKIYLNDAAFSHVEDPTNDFGVGRKPYSGLKNNLKCLVQCFYQLKDDCVQYKTNEKFKPKTIEELYYYIQDASKSYRENVEQNTLTKYQTDSLLPTLRDYQAEAIHWMVSQERYEHTNNDASGVHPLWQEIRTEEGDVIYLQLYSGRLSKIKPKPNVFPKGGILAEEMGLGKTVEILALHFNNPKPTKYENTRLVIEKELVIRKRFSSSHLNCTLPPSKVTREDGSDCVHQNIDRKRDVSFEQASTMVTDKALESTSAHTVFNNSTSYDKLYETTTTDLDDILTENSVKCLESDEKIKDAVQGLIDDMLGKCAMYSTNTPKSSGKEKIWNKKKQQFTEVDIWSTCSICSEDVVNSNQISCSKCPNILHPDCSGYGDLQLTEYYCTTCSMKEMVDSHCTLIVCPDTLQKQFYNEIKMHVKENSIKFMIYQGVKHHKFLPPRVLAEYDFIITSFSTLRQEFNYVKADDAAACRTLRHRKRYAVLPCPLLAIHFWRMCIDEAQMVEADNTKLAEMCLRISSVHRWCVTGTPFNRGMEDIYGLLLFLGVQPYNNKLWWHRALLDHYRNGNFLPLFDTMKKLMWRTCKDDVIDQIGIPKQTENVTWLQLSAVDRHFYQRQQDVLIKAMEKHLEKYFPDSESKLVKISDLSKFELQRVLYPLLQLRQACIHPSVVRDCFVNIEKKCVSMDQVLLKLIDNANLECVEAHRKLICALNGLAGIYILKEDYLQALETYSQAIASWEEKSHLETDSLQKLHTMHNLLEISSKVNESSVDTDSVKNNCDQLRSDYMKVVDTEAFESWYQLEQLVGEVQQTRHDHGNQEFYWWKMVLEVGIERDERFYEKVVIALESVNGRSSSNILGRFRNMDGLVFTVMDKMKQINELRGEVLKSLEEIKDSPSKEAVLQATECCLRPVEGSDAPRCTYCLVNSQISSYESHLYSQQVEDFLSEGTLTGYRGETQLEAFLKYLYSIVKNHRLHKYMEPAKLHLKYMELLKREFKEIRRMYLACHRRVQAIDELEMCISRLRFPYPGEKDIENKTYIIHPTEVESTRLILCSDKLIAAEELNRKERQIVYLKNLEKAQTRTSSYNPEQCPICVGALGSKWAVFRCGHCVCCECLVRMEQQQTYQRKHLRCPLCRMELTSKSVSLVTLPTNTSNVVDGTSFDAFVTVKGNLSTKIEAIIRRVLWIKETYPGAKTLLFSTWSNVLYVIGQVLTFNNVVFKSLDGRHGKQFEQTLQVFKECANCNVLLLPLHSGAKGLNIIEATHVILAEPALKPSDELQAVGRVHRIGQTKETFVHRFLVKETVEEKMFHFFKTKPDNEKDALLESSLTVQDVMFLFRTDHQQTSEE